MAAGPVSRLGSFENRELRAAALTTSSTRALRQSLGLD